METKKLYYENCHLRFFEGKVLSCLQTPKGWEVILDQTAFYPEGGGQACDTGVLADANVLSVREENDTVIHLCDAPLAEGSIVTGQLNWERRFDLMQQHTGEHIVSGIINATFGYHNVGFHVGADATTIDFDGEISYDALADIERRANEAVWQNLPLKCWYPTPAQLPQVTYRTKRELPWPVRIVQVPGYDSCACCGVHVASTGEVGLIKLLSCVKFHQGVRIEMVCGGRAVSWMSKVYEQNRQVSQIFSAKILETGEAARRVNEALNQEKYRAAGLEKKVFSLMAQRYADTGDALLIEPELNPNGVRELADAIAQVCGGTAAVFSGSDETGYSVCLASRQGDVKELGQAMAKALDGRGGGKPGFFQGSIKATEEAIRTFWSQK